MLVVNLEVGGVVAIVILVVISKLCFFWCFIDSVHLLLKSTTRRVDLHLRTFQERESKSSKHKIISQSK